MDEASWLDERIARIPTRQNEFGYDPFGFHREKLRSAARLASWLYRYYFRTEAYGIEQVPDGRVILVSNHAGQLPFDALNIILAMLLVHEPPRLLRAMVEKFIPRAPFVSYLFARWGQIVGTPENCLRLLQDEEAILVFPEGVRGISKPFTRRYQLEDFGHGFMRLALRAHARVVPVAVIGSEEQAPSVNLSRVARLLGLPSLPLMLLPPFVPLPYPVKYRIYFGEPLSFSASPEEAEDEGVLGEHVRTVRNSVQTLIQIGLKERRHVFW